jgi:hypothetical protein
MRWSLMCLVAALGLGLGLGVVSSSDAWASPKKKEVKATGVITWKVQPGDVVIYVDGKKVGVAKNAKPHKVSAGMHVVKLVWGKDEMEDSLDVPANQSIEFQYTFEDSGKPGQQAPPADEF